jgi:hypothetical protein
VSRAPDGAARVAVAAIVLQPLVWAGMGRRYPWAIVGLESEARIGWGVIAVLLLAFGLAVARWLADRRAAVRRAAVALLFACPLLTAGYNVLASRHFERFGYGPPGRLLLLDAFVIAALALWLKSSRPPGSGAALAAAAAACHRLLATTVFPLDERRSDMLASILRAAEVWQAGGAPYSEVPSPGLKYLPGTWLAHVPAAWLGVDPRIPGAILLGIVGLVFAASLRSRKGPAAPGSLGEILAMLVLLNPYHAFRHELYFDAFLALTAAIFLLASREEGGGRSLSLPAVSVMTGLAAATRQWAWVYGPFAVLASALPSGRLRLRWARLAAAAALAFLTGALVAAPFALQDPAGLRRGVFAFSGETFSEACLGVSALAAALGVAGLLPVVQAAVCLGSFGRALALAARGLATQEGILVAGWFTWVAVVLLNPFLENYFYLSPGFAAAALAVSRRV